MEWPCTHICTHTQTHTQSVEQQHGVATHTHILRNNIMEGLHTHTHIHTAEQQNGEASHETTCVVYEKSLGSNGFTVGEGGVCLFITGGRGGGPRRVLPQGPFLHNLEGEAK